MHSFCIILAMGVKESKQKKTAYITLENQGPSNMIGSESLCMEKWMGRVPDETPLLELTLPGSHNSATYLTKNFLFKVKDFVACQDRSILEQLKCGVRCLDLRVSLFLNKQHVWELWCGHTFMTVPLSQVVADVRAFLTDYPSEVVLVDVKPDYSPVNAEWCGLANISEHQKRRVKKPSRLVLEGIFGTLFGDSTYQEHVHRDTELSRVRGKVIGYVNGHRWFNGIDNSAY